MNIKHFLKKAAFYPLAISIMVWEEAFYKPVNALGQYLGRHPSLRAIQVKISNVPPFAALAIFIVPVVTLFPFKMAGLWLLSQGHPILGGAIFASAKVVGAALFTRIFTLTENSIRKIGLINTSLDYFFDKKNKLINYWKASPVYAHIHEFKNQIKEKYKSIKMAFGFKAKEVGTSDSNLFLNEEKEEIKNLFLSKSNFNTNSKTSNVEAIQEESLTVEINMDTNEVTLEKQELKKQLNLSTSSVPQGTGKNKP